MGWNSAMGACFGLIFYGGTLFAQTTDGTFHGFVFDSGTRSGISGARVQVRNAAGSLLRTTVTGAFGRYTISSLPPTTYWVRVEHPSGAYRPSELHGIVLPVAGALEQQIEMVLRNDIFEQGGFRSIPVPGSDQLATFYGPDLDLTRKTYIKRAERFVRIWEPSVSAVVDPLPIRDLPFFGRDVFNMLLTLPGVSLDVGSARSLGLSANGVRPASSTFLLDGLEFNNNLVSGPLLALAPEAVQEYRVSTAGYSAEYGRTAGYIANAVTRAGTFEWHGLGYMYGKSEVINANDFQNNAFGIPRPRLREHQTGYQVGGPAFRGGARGRLFVASATEVLYSTGKQPRRTVYLPSEGFLRFVNSFAVPNATQRLFRRYSLPPSSPVANDPFLGSSSFSPPSTIARGFVSSRADATIGANRYYARLINGRFNRPDFIWSPYDEFTSGLTQKADHLAVGAVHVPTSSTTAELRVGLSADEIAWTRAQPDVPTLQILGGNTTNAPILPGSPAAYSYKYSGFTTEVNANVHVFRGRHSLKFGGGAIKRTLTSDLPYASAGLFTFGSLGSFGTLAAAGDAGMRFHTSVDRLLLDQHQFVPPLTARRYRYVQTTLFVQHSFRLTSRVVAHAGVRLESLGAPSNVGTKKDTFVVLGSGISFGERLSTASLIGTDSNQAVLETAGRTVAIRTSFALDLSRATNSVRRTVLRWGYGTFYDRPIDNMWLTLASNSIVYPASGLRMPNQTDFLKGTPALLNSVPYEEVSRDFPRPVMFQPHLPHGYAQHFFLRLQRQLRATQALDSGLQGSFGRKLLVQDVVNRNSRYNSGLPPVSYLSSQGTSNYLAWSTHFQHRSPHLFLVIAHTWSHAIDNQSDPLAGDFFNLAFTADPSMNVRRSGFAEEFDAGSDRGNADFDQRHSGAIAIVHSTRSSASSAILSRFKRNWRFAALGTFRSGMPFSVIDAVSISPGRQVLLSRRADVLDPDLVWKPSQSTLKARAGGKMLLNPDAFCRPPKCVTDRSVMGNTGRNAFTGPAFSSLDVSASRSFPISARDERLVLTFRADAFNLLNHANLNQPVANLTSIDFGFASYGRQAKDIGFPAVLPVRETARQIQLMFRLEF